MSTFAWFEYAGSTMPLDSLSYEPSIGITPQSIQITAIPVYPYLSSPPEYGDVMFGEADLATQAFPAVIGGLNRQITVQGCKLSNFRATFDSRGVRWVFELLDRRWKWQIGPMIDVWANQLDQHSKLIPWSVRSPFQLAQIYLNAMGEINYQILGLPGGLYNPDAVDSYGIQLLPGPNDVPIDPVADYLALGQNYAQTGTNLGVDQTAVNAALGLRQLCDQYGCVVVFDPITNTVSLIQMGEGNGLLPNQPYLSYVPSLSTATVPAAIKVQGAPIRFQMRFQTRAVGREWDDSWQIINRLSYAPSRSSSVMQVYWKIFSPDIIINGVRYQFPTIAQMIAAINADPRNNQLVKASNVGGFFTLTGITTDYINILNIVGNNSSVVCISAPVSSNWKFGFEGMPQNFFVFGAGAGGLPNVLQQTPELPLVNVIDLCQRYIYRTYQLIATDPFTGEFGVPVPGIGITTGDIATLTVGPQIVNGTAQNSTVGSASSGPGAVQYRVTNRYLIQLQDTRPEQLVPQKADINLIDFQTGLPFVNDVYNGYSKDKRPVSFGAVYRGFVMPGAIWAPNNNVLMENTPPTTAFYIPFSIIDPERQVIQYSTPVYQVLGVNNANVAGMIPTRVATLPTDPVIETGAIILDQTTLQPLRYTQITPIDGGTAPTATYIFDDIQLEIIGAYSPDHSLTGYRFFNADAINRANYYTQAIIRTLQVPESAIVTYIGILPQTLSGQVRQISWEIDGNSQCSFRTTVSLNTEHSKVILPYPRRRFLENLKPVGDRGPGQGGGKGGPARGSDLTRLPRPSQSTGFGGSIFNKGDE